jgi:glycine/D-amino acid oxidase-like deaminating enzyme
MIIQDFAIIGNGILGTLSSYEIKKKLPNAKISLIGPTERNYSASIAAGAMHAIYGEIEKDFDISQKEKTQYSIGLLARKYWINLINELNSKDLILANDTIFYAKKNGSTFERDNFEKAIQIAGRDGCLDHVSNLEIKKIFKGILPAEKFDIVKLKGEFSIHPPTLFKILDEKCKNLNVSKVNSLVKFIDLKSNVFSIHLNNDEIIYAKKIIITAGSESSRILSNLTKIVPIIKGVGTALILNFNGSIDYPENYVIRTTNRGGAQCGLHIVPYLNKQFYIGAGNYLSKDPSPQCRAETVRYLTNSCEAEMFGRDAIYQSELNLLLGYRPRSLDGLPLVGSPKNQDNLFVATGNNRVALTLATSIVKEICNWAEQSQGISSDFKGYEPDRDLVSWGSLNGAKDYYSNSRLSNLIEHNLINVDDNLLLKEKKAELEDYSIKMNKEIIKKLNLKKDFVVDPDLYNLL